MDLRVLQRWCRCLNEVILGQSIWYHSQDQDNLMCTSEERLNPKRTSLLHMRKSEQLLVSHSCYVSASTAAHNWSLKSFWVMWERMCWLERMQLSGWPDEQQTSRTVLQSGGKDSWHPVRTDSELLLPIKIVTITLDPATHPTLSSRSHSLSEKLTLLGTPHCLW